MTKTILIIEDDKSINEMLQKVLKLNKFNVMYAYSGTEGLLIHNDKVDLILLDLMLPGKSGEEIIRDLKKINDVPIIVISAISDIDMKLSLFSLGADDYVTKPFNNEELIARINVHLRKKNQSSNANIKIGNIELDLKKYEVICDNQIIKFSKIEFEILKLLMENCNQVVTKSFLFDHIWDSYNSADENTLNVHISKIRTKLKKINPNFDYIETIWSIGYKFKN